MKPTFTALILNYNDFAQVGRALKNVFTQSVPFDEILIIDDGSTDESVVFIEQLIKDVPQARLHRNRENIGIVASVNLGFTLAKSDYIHPVSANDRYLPHIVEYGHKMIERYPGVAMVCGNSGVWDALTDTEMEPMLVRIEQKEQFVTPEFYRQQNRIAPVSLYGGAATIHRRTYLDLGGQDPKLAWYADWFLYYLIGLTHGFAYVPQIYVILRLEGKKSFSSGRFHWQLQEPVLKHFFGVLHDCPAEQRRIFREIALFPQYNLRTLALALEKPNRWFITPLFVWRCIGHQCAYWLRAILPRRILMALRKIVRL